MASPNTGIQYFTIPGFKFAAGYTKEIKVAYRSFNPTSTKGTVLIPTCYGGRIDTTLNFTSGALKNHHVIVVAMLGNGESSSPSNDDNFPGDYSLRYQDCIKSQYTLLTQHLRIKSLEAVIGFSMGGQQAYYWAAMHGTGVNPFLKCAVVICSSAKTSGHNYAFLEGPIAALTTSHDYDHGNYKRNGVKAVEGLRAFSRAYAAWLTSAEWFRQELWRELGAQSLREWLDPPVGKSSREDWDPEDLLVLARMWQAGDIGTVAGDGDYQKALEAITAKVLVMPSATDQYFPPKDGEVEVQHLKYGIFQPIPTVWGHMAGGGANPVDVRWMEENITQFLEVA
ncbi:Alpha/Beta hydrolase protein [Clohesyomyces aquaticus]|uniref:Alpha/Beta hydrolase protein n=1 Tax=Clohesyomyces aquaticus TaxID=1231657 RepID=A0A1Y1Z2F8_9PLEO|nr:Alpha/Beta hydrolase protein [Clohesyomyces aquaticus]